MNFLKLKIEKIAIHQLFSRGEDGVEIPPTKGVELIKFDDEALQDFKNRVYNALGNESSSVEMTISDTSPESTPYYIDSLYDCDDESFIEGSYNIAKNLSKAQTRRGMSGGIVVVFSATYQHNKLPLIGIIKADLHSGYEKKINNKTGVISLAHVKEILLTPSTKLYKSAGFFRRDKVENDNSICEKWVINISDFQIDKSNGKAAAKYFYQDFLGCTYPLTTARITKQYFDLTSDFINKMDINNEDKINLHNVLYAQLKSGVSDKIDPLKLAEQYMSTSDIDDYRNFLDENNFKTAAFLKDIKYIESNLKKRRIKFSKNIQIIAPTEVFEEFVTIEGNNSNQDLVTIIIKDRILTQ